MLDSLYFKSGHLTKLAYLMLDSDKLCEHEKELFLAHISACETCMKYYIDSLTDDSLEIPSDALSDSIVKNVLAEAENKKQTKILFMQFTKLAIAVCLTMVIFFSGALGFSIGNFPKVNMSSASQIMQDQKPEKRPIKSKSEPSFFDGIFDSMNKGFTGFADQINFGIKGDAAHGTK